MTISPTVGLRETFLVAGSTTEGGQRLDAEAQGGDTFLGTGEKDIVFGVQMAPWLGTNETVLDGPIVLVDEYALGSPTGDVTPDLLQERDVVGSLIRVSLGNANALYGASYVITLTVTTSEGRTVQVVCGPIRCTGPFNAAYAITRSPSMLYATPTLLGDVFIDSASHTAASVEALNALSGTLPTTYIAIARIGVPSGVASLDSAGLVPTAQIPLAGTIIPGVNATPGGFLSSDEIWADANGYARFGNPDPEKVVAGSARIAFGGASPRYFSLYVGPGSANSAMSVNLGFALFSGTLGSILSTTPLTLVNNAAGPVVIRSVTAGVGALGTFIQLGDPTSTIVQEWGQLSAGAPIITAGIDGAGNLGLTSLIASAAIVGQTIAAQATANMFSLGKTDGAGHFAMVFTHAATAARTITVPDVTGTLITTANLADINAITAAALPAFLNPTTFFVSDAATNTFPVVMTFNHTSSAGINVAPGLGTTLSWSANSDLNAGRAQAALITTWAVAADATRRAQMQFFVNDAAASRATLTMSTNGTAATIGFLGSAAVIRQVVSGSRGGNVAVASLLTALATLGLITDSTSA